MLSIHTEDTFIKHEGTKKTNLGDLGASSGAVFLALAAEELTRKDSLSPVLVYTASDLGYRSAVCLI